MAKTLNFTFEGKEYVLEFTRDTVRAMERAGFIADDLLNKPMTLFPELFAYAFQAHHRWDTKRKDIDRIFAAMPNRAELLTKLVEMYRDPLTELMEDPEGAAEGNVSWTANF